ncbi:head GIN domain-containing protein [Emticicia sp. 21SJ11W-3]|uniref:head GIN domain-containing protein n=1 Tax=Emticicia sp. 21SJ11W-3 TaxID=2916755 RepID=UPI0020A064E4|nr:head GIN domain-containing protein [Emticicia sp. 21SJ11W-3]UTA67770.1 DUF2807 domain-containing protein [Emticicia sp. 21SJ11W-3]
MKKLFILLLFIATAATAQESKRSFSLSGFDKLDMGNAFIITVTQSNNYKIETSGREQDLEDLVVKVSNGELRIGYPSNWSGWKNRKEVYINITMPKLVAVSFSGASKAKVSGFSSESFGIDLSGASSATFDIDAKNLALDCSGASSVAIVGDGQKLTADVSGASSVNAYDFKVSTATIDASGSSGAKVYVTSRIVAEASGASSVRYKGGATSVVANTSGAGTVKSAN